ncbi:MAG: carboxypeptidase regulatory-like domain-containing protein, partial [Chloroflexi bacterium]|nr:carboxypeptidase regulatory-like domain-containing protein [Chloroflexota bacterium]
LDMTFPRGVLLTGVVRDARGAPVEGATVNVNDASGGRFFGDTDIGGRYSIAVLPGTYTVDVFSPRWGAALSVLGQELTIERETGYEVVLPDAEPEAGN